MKSICNVKFVYSVSSSISLAFLTSSSTFNQIHGFIFIEMNYFAIQTIRSEVLNTLHFSPPFESGGTLKGACRTRSFLRQFRIASNANVATFGNFLQKSGRAFPNKIIILLVENYRNLCELLRSPGRYYYSSFYASETLCIDLSQKPNYHKVMETKYQTHYLKHNP